MVICRTSLAKGSFGISSEVDFWKNLISLSASVPGLTLRFGDLLASASCGLLLSASGFLGLLAGDGLALIV
jgi:hypothetical protein